MIKTQEKLDEIARMLESDLRTLFGLVFTHRKPVAEGDVRIASVILRKWMIDGLLSNFCGAANIKPTLPAIDNNKVLAELKNHPSITYFLTGGVRFNGAPIEGIYNSTEPFSGRPPIPVDRMPFREFNLSEFLRQKRLYFEGSFFSTEEIIKYTANKMGGAHLDYVRLGPFDKLEKAASFMKYGGPLQERFDPQCEVYLALEPTGSEILSAMHIEIIVAATSFLQIRLNGDPLIRLETKRSLRSRISQLFGRTRRKFVLHDFGQRP